MPLLLYCVTGPTALLNSSTGVAGSPVSRFEHDGLAAFYSENATSDIWLRAPLRSSASEFHRVQRDLFQSVTILPFRFPTILENDNKLREHLAANAADYKSLLDRFAGCAQIDITLTFAADPPKPSSGAAYLQGRQARTRNLEQFAHALRKQASSLLRDWRQRSASNGLRCFALLERKQVEEFNETIKRLSVPEGIAARVSGPWPVAEFLDLTL